MPHTSDPLLLAFFNDLRDFHSIIKSNTYCTASQMIFFISKKIVPLFDAYGGYRSADLHFVKDMAKNITPKDKEQNFMQIIIVHFLLNDESKAKQYITSNNITSFTLQPV